MFAKIHRKKYDRSALGNIQRFWSDTTQSAVTGRMVTSRYKSDVFSFLRNNFNKITTMNVQCKLYNNKAEITNSLKFSHRPISL